MLHRVLAPSPPLSFAKLVNLWQCPATNGIEHLKSDALEQYS